MLTSAVASLRNKRQAERLAEDAKAIEAVIRMFDPEFNARAIAARRPVAGNPWFKRGTMFRAALDALRAAQGPMAVREMVDAILAAKGLTDVTKKQHNGLQSGLRASLEGHAGKTLEGIPMRWRLI